MEVEQQKRGWLPAIPEIVAGTGQVVFLLYAVGSRLDPYFLVTIGVILYGILIGTILYRKWAEDKHQLAVLKLKSEESKSRHWVETMQKPALSQGEKEGSDRMARQNTYISIISALEATANDTSLSNQERDVYGRIIKRLKDMQSASQF